jgi:hypothetical protein
MAHFAELDEQNTVIRVVVISNDDILDENGVEQEQVGIALCNQHIGQGNWVQTSYNNNFRRVFGRVGYKYDPDKQLFYDPHGPFPSWIMDDEYNWTPPTDRPDPIDGFFWVWDERTLSWISEPTPENFPFADVPVIGE